jgi:toluene monooxygenase electron transfer component
MPYECNSGSCGTCKVELVSGTVESAVAAAPGLGDRDRAKNRVLACQSRPTSDCAIKVRLRPENVPVAPAGALPREAPGTRDLTHDLREFRFQAEGRPGFSAGQYALFSLPGVTGLRTYSMSNVDDGSGEWQFMVKRMPGGIGTAALFDDVPVGASLELDGPYGLAYLRKDSPRDLLCIGGGSGLAPILSIVRGAVREPSLDGGKSTFSTARAPAGHLRGGGALGPSRLWHAHPFPAGRLPARGRGRVDRSHRLRPRARALAVRRTLQGVRVLLRRAAGDGRGGAAHVHGRARSFPAGPLRQFLLTDEE